MSDSNTNNNSDFVFGKSNYIFLIIGLAVVFLGFLLMSGGGNNDLEKFNDAIFNFQRIKLAPTVVFIGFGVIIYAILKKDKK